MFSKTFVVRVVFVLVSVFAVACAGEVTPGDSPACQTHFDTIGGSGLPKTAELDPSSCLGEDSYDGPVKLVVKTTPHTISRAELRWTNGVLTEARSNGVDTLPFLTSDDGISVYVVDLFSADVPPPAAQTSCQPGPDGTCLPGTTTVTMSSPPVAVERLTCTGIYPLPGEVYLPYAYVSTGYADGTGRTELNVSDQHFTRDASMAAVHVDGFGELLRFEAAELLLAKPAPSTGPGMCSFDERLYIVRGVWTTAAACAYEYACAPSQDL